MCASPRYSFQDEIEQRSDFPKNLPSDVLHLAHRASHPTFVMPVDEQGISLAFSLEGAGFAWN
jgi:hypothetical protein